MNEKLFCVMCGTEIPEERLKRRAVTCKEECAKERTRYLHRRTARRKCRYCMQPATPEEQSAFKRWRKKPATPEEQASYEHWRNWQAAQPAVRAARASAIESTTQETPHDPT
jgi:hypothetical protein